jgi:hypothetical protein
MGLDRLIYSAIRKGDISLANFSDSIPLNFGSSKDVAVQWTGSLLTVIPLTDDTGAINIGNGTKDIDLKIFLGTTGQYVDFNVGNGNIKMIGTPKGATLEMTPGVGGAGLKIHTHANVNNSGGATYDYTFLNEFKGEFVSTSGLMYGVGAIYSLATSAGGMSSMIATATLIAGATLSGADVATGSWLSAGFFATILAGTSVLNGTAVTVTGLYAQVSSTNTPASVLTACMHVSALQACTKLLVIPTSGQASILLLQQYSGGAVIPQAIYLEGSSTVKAFVTFDVAGDDSAIEAATSNMGTHATSYAIKIKVGAVEGWIPVFDNHTWN